MRGGVGERKSSKFLSCSQLSQLFLCMFSALFLLFLIYSVMQGMGPHKPQFPNAQAKWSPIMFYKWGAPVEILLEWEVEKWFYNPSFFFMVFLASRTVATTTVFMMVRVAYTAANTNRSLEMLALYFLLRLYGSQQKQQWPRHARLWIPYQAIWLQQIC